MGSIQELKDRIKNINWVYRIILFLTFVFVIYIFDSPAINNDHSILEITVALIIGFGISTTLLYIALIYLLPEGNTEQDDTA